MSVFTKPHMQGFAGKVGGTKGRRPVPRRTYPYPAKLFGSNDIFSIVPLDSGAFFFTQEHLGGATADRFITALESGALLRPWQTGRKIDWDRAYDESAHVSYGTAHEKHVWLNRLYFLLPVAQQFFHTKDQRWAAAWLKYLADWSKAHPYPETVDAGDGSVPAGRQHHAKQCWRDAQVTWRLLILIHSVRLLGKCRSIKKQEWEVIYEAIHRHGRHVHLEASRELSVSPGQESHFLQKGTALLYAGVLFPEFPEAAEFIAAGRAIVERQMNAEVHSDGGSVGASPSSAHFVARLFLDAYLLLEKNKQPPIKGLKNSLQKQYRFLDETASPAGRSLRLSDSYALDADADLELVSKLFPFARAARKASACFRDSGIAILRGKRAEVVVDGAPLGRPQHHRGKPNILVWLDGEPLLIDSGCCNHDLELLEAWLKTANAHNTVIVSPDKDDREFLGPRDIPVVRIAGFEHARGRSAVMMIHQFASERIRYEWTRTVAVRDPEVEIIDRIIAPSPVHSRQVFHFAQSNVGLTGDRRQAWARRGGSVVLLRQLGGTGQGSFELAHHPAVGPDNRFCYSPEVSSRAYGTEIQFHVRFSP